MYVTTSSEHRDLLDSSPSWKLASRYHPFTWPWKRLGHAEYKYPSVNLPSHLGCEKWGKKSLTKHTPAAVLLASLTWASLLGRAVEGVGGCLTGARHTDILSGRTMGCDSLSNGSSDHRNAGLCQRERERFKALTFPFVNMEATEDEVFFPFPRGE